MLKLFFALVIFTTTFKSFSASVMLAWDPSPDAGVVTYKVYYGGASGNYTNSALVGNVTSATLTGLADGATYYFSATAVDDLGSESAFSNETTTTTPLPANQPPTLNTLANFAISEDASSQAVNLSGISSGSASETQTLSVTASSSNPGLIPNPTVAYTSPSATGTLTLAPVANAFGSATITVTVNDGAASNNIVTRTFVVTVNPVNDTPTLNALVDVAINQNAGVQTVNLTGISSGAANESQTLVVTASSSNTGLIPTPTVSYNSPNATGSLGFAPIAGASGVTTITVTANDGGSSNNIVTRSFVVTVNSVNQAPTLDALANLAVNEGLSQTVNVSGISSGAANELQTLTVTATSSKPSLIPNPTVAYTSPNSSGVLTLTPATGTSGSAIITVTVNDGGASNNIVTRSFTATINRLPTISALTNQTIVVNTATPAIPFTISDIETTAANLIVTASSANQTLVPDGNILLAGPAGNRTVTITPAADATGVADITIRVGDGTGSSTRTFQLTVRPLPTPPSNLRVAQALP